MVYMHDGGLYGIKECQRKFIAIREILDQGTILFAELREYCSSTEELPERYEAFLPTKANPSHPSGPAQRDQGHE